MRKFTKLSFSALGAVAMAAGAVTIAAQTPPQPPHWADQGAKWTDAARQEFYTRYQGSQIMPLSWLKALRQPDGSLFLADDLARYGYLPNPANGLGLPVGFTVTPSGVQQVGMTCAACHTRQIEVGADAYRIDGGPAIVDFQRFLKDLDADVGAILANEAAFDSFARDALGGSPTGARKAQLRLDVTEWYARNHTIMSLALPADSPWGMGRADAVQMIFDRLTGLDIGPAPDHILVNNIQKADAPVRYPFLWNAAFESKTQWMGFAANGDDTLGLLRNLGQSIGVFAKFAPQTDVPGFPDYWAGGSNSVDIAGLKNLEARMKDIGPPKWPWPYKGVLANDGKGIFKHEGGCSGCHGDPDAASGSLHLTRMTAANEVGTDTRQLALLTRAADTGALNGDIFLLSQLKPNDTALNVLIHAVGNTYFQSLFRNPKTGEFDALAAASRNMTGSSVFSRSEGIALLKQFLASQSPGFEARRLQGVWAAAPYLHNGSVATLADLLKPAAKRAPTFLVGPEYDRDNVGLAVAQPRFSSQMKTTFDCDHPDSGNSRCGHEYGTKLTDQQKQALLEYLKTL